MTGEQRETGIVRFIGRERELAAITATVRAGGAIVLTGEPGVGKTRLATETAARFRHEGWAVVVRHGTPALSALPVGMFSDLMEPTDAALSSGEALSRAYRSVASRLAGGRSLLVIDDAPLVDPASATLVQRIIENQAAAVVLTCRRGEPLPDGLAALRPGAALATLEIDPMARSDALRLAAAAAGGRLPPERLEQIADLAAGTPLFVVGLVYEQLSGRRRSSATTDLDALLHRRFNRLGPGERAALEVLALGAPLELDMVDRICTADALEALERSGLIEVLVEDRRRAVHVAHPLYAEAVRASLGALRRRRLLRQLAEQAEASGMRRHDDLLRLVLWRLDAGDRVEPDVLVHAARSSLSRGGVATAERVLDIVLNSPGSGSRSRPVDTIVEASCLLANIRIEQGRPTDAAALCVAAPAGASPPLQSKLAMIHWIALFIYLGDVDAAREIVERSKHEIDPPWDLEVRYNEIALEFYAGSATAAVDSVDALLGEAEIPERTWVWFMAPGVLALATAGRTADAVAHAETCIGKAPGYADIVGIEAHAWCTWAYASVYHRGPVGCLDPIEIQFDRARASGDQVSAGFLQMVIGLLRFHEGRLTEAIELLDLPFEIGGGWALFAAALRVQALALAGDAEGAATALGATAVIPQCRFHAALNHCAAAEVALVEGRPDDAQASFREAADYSATNGQHTFSALATFRAFTCAPTEERARALLDATTRLDGPLSGLLGAAAEAWSAGSVTSIERLARDLERCGHVLYALHARALVVDLLSRQPTTARAAVRAGEALERRWGQARRRRKAAGAPRPRLRPAAEGRSGSHDRPDAAPPTNVSDAGSLTVRERQVAQLAATGLTDHAIADELQISLRTVHAHLRATYRKLGLSGRRELRARAIDAPPAGDTDTVR